MNSEQAFTLAASAAFLGLAALAATRGAKNPLGLPLGLLCVVLFAYNGLEVVGSVTGSSAWDALESAAAALAAPLLAHFTLAFLGARRDQRRFLLAAYAYFGVLALSCLAALIVPALATYPAGPVWAALMLAGLGPSVTWLAILLVRHYRASGSAEERARTQLFIGTIAIGVGGVATDLLSIAGASSGPRLAAWGMLLSAILLTALTLRFRLLRGTVVLLAVNAAIIAVVGVALQLIVFRWLGRESALLVFGTVGVTIISLGAARTVGSAMATYRERAAQLATLGRLSAQMAHDIRNPLAAIRGAAQYLEGERDGTSATSRELITLIIEQADRLERVVRDYQRLGRAEPVRTHTDVAELLAGVVEGAKVSEKATEKAVILEVDGELGELALDPDLVRAALENLVRNALEAIEESRVGTGVRVKGERRLVGGRDALVLEVVDDGPGMDPRTLEQAEDAFFTTKAEGSGLGLAFARRVAEAHAGELTIESRFGRGTRVRLVFASDTSVT